MGCRNRSDPLDDPLESRIREGRDGKWRESGSFDLAGTVRLTGYSVGQPHTRHILGELWHAQKRAQYAKYVPSMCRAWRPTMHDWMHFSTANRITIPARTRCAGPSRRSSGAPRLGLGPKLLLDLEIGDEGPPKLSHFVSFCPTHRTDPQWAKPCSRRRSKVQALPGSFVNVSTQKNGNFPRRNRRPFIFRSCLPSALISGRRECA